MAALKTYRIEVALKARVTDAAGAAVKRNIVEDLGIPVKDVRVIRAYTILSDLPREKIETLRTELFTDPIIEVSKLDKPLAKNFSWVIEVGFKPGVTDNVGKTSGEAARDIFGNTFSECNVFTSKQYVIKGDLKKKQARAIAEGLLANGLIEQWIVAGSAEFKRKGGIALPPPIAGEQEEITVNEFDLDVSDRKLVRISSDGILSLNLDEMHTIRDHFRNEATVRSRGPV